MAWRSIAASLVVTSVAAGQASFEDVTAEAGLNGFIATAGDEHGPGCVFTDLDGDGYPDLYLPKQGVNELYRNVPDGAGGRRFERVLGDGGAGHAGPATGAIAGDYDNDGDLDLYVTNFNAPNVLLMSLRAQIGGLLFIDVTAQTDAAPFQNDGQYGVGFAEDGAVLLDNSLTAAFADIDRDGDLDLYVGNHDGWLGGPMESPLGVPGQRDVLYRNEGDGTFTDVSTLYGVTGFTTADGQSGTGLQHYSSTNAVIFADLDGDRWPDLLVTNKVGGPTDRDMLYRNRGADADGNWLGFELLTWTLVPTFGNQSPAAMGVDVGDFDNDGDLDLYLTDWAPPELGPDAPGRNDLWLNQLAETGSIGFVHRGDLSACYSWGAQWIDVDADGRLDLHVSTEGDDQPYVDVLYHNDGTSMTDIAGIAGVDQARNSRGDVTADYDGDGWTDLFVVNLDGGPSALYANRTAQLAPERETLCLHLRGDANGPGPYRSTRDAIGAQVVVRADLNGDGAVGPGETQLREVLSGSSNAASTSSLDVELGLGIAAYADVTVRWPSGVDLSFIAVPDQRLLVEEGRHPADVNGDGAVDVLDLVEIILGWGACPGDPCAADIHHNGMVDVQDLVMLILNWSVGRG